MTRSRRYELELEETLKRHRSKPLADEVSEGTVASWYRRDDIVRELAEVVSDATLGLRGALKRVLADVGWGS